MSHHFKCIFSLFKKIFFKKRGKNMNKYLIHGVDYQPELLPRPTPRKSIEQLKDFPIITVECPE